MKIISLFTALTILAFGCNSKKTEQNLPNVSSGSIERIENFESKFIVPRNVDVWLPKDYSLKKTYNVFYMHDGQMLFDSTKTWNGQEWAIDETFSKLINEGEIGETIVVGIWNAGKERHTDYLPKKPFEMLPKAKQDSLITEGQAFTNRSLFANNLNSDNYLKFIVEELKPYIDKKYATKTEKEATFIGGSSMGGLISMYALCEYPDVFIGAACISTHWPSTYTEYYNPIPDCYVKYFIKNAPNPETHKFYFDYGTETLDAMYEPYQLMIDSVFYNLGWTNNYKSLKFEGADHSENSWRSRFDIPLKFLLSE